jgi:serine/threonine protein kinase
MVDRLTAKVVLADADALAPRDANAQRLAKAGPDPKAAKAAQLRAMKEKDHPPPPPPEVVEPPSGDRPDGVVYTAGKMLGKGGFAICYQGQSQTTRQKVALKIVKSQMPSKMEQKVSGLGGGGRHSLGAFSEGVFWPAADRLTADARAPPPQFQTELQIHSKMRHRNIVQFFRAFSFVGCTFLVLELCPNGSLMDMVKKRRGLTEAETRFYTVQIAGAIKYMHSKGIIHRDLKMGNIFLDAHMNAKIGDFGLAALMVTGRDMQTIRRTTLCGTPNYIAPEILEKGKRGHDHMVDIWSLGVIV